MISATIDFQNAAIANYRDPRVRVEVTWTDSILDTSISVDSDENNRGSEFTLSQVADGNTITGRKWAHLNTSIVPDGTYFPMPGPDIGPQDQVGWYTKTPCDASRLWAANPVLRVSFTKRPVVDLVLSFDTVYNEYAEDYTLRFYQGLTLLHTEVVTGNTNVTETIDLSSYSILDCDLITLELVKWSDANQVGKVCECYSSIVDIFRDDDVVSLNILEELDTENASLPIGNISCNEIDLSLLNTDSRFRFGNTNSVYNSLLKKNRRIRVWLGFVLPSTTSDVSSGDYIVETVNGDIIGYQPYGVYWSEDWDSNYRSIETNTTARDRMEVLRKLDFKNNIVWQNISLYDLANNVMIDAVNYIPDLIWEVDEGLKNTIIPIAFFDRISYFEVIRRIVQAGLTYAYVDRVGTVIIGKTITNPDPTETITTIQDDSSAANSWQDDSTSTDIIQDESS